MSVTKRENVWYVRFRYVCPQTGTRRRFMRSTGAGTTKAEALELEARWRLEALNPPDPEPQLETKRAAFSGFARHWLDTYCGPSLKPTTLRSYERACRLYLVPFFGSAWLRHIDAERVEMFKAWMLRRELAAKTINNVLGVLSSLFEVAVTWGYAERNPVAGVKALRLPPAEVTFYTQEDGDRFLATCLRVRPQWHALFATALRTGMRQGELFGLLWSDLDLDNARVRVRRSHSEGTETTPKSGHARTVPLPSDLVDILRRHPRHISSPLVFPAASGRHLKNSGVWKRLRYVQRVAALEEISFHDLRHSYASQLVMAGVPLKAVQEYLGHADIQTTMRYAHLSPKARADFVEVLAVKPASPSAEVG